MVGSGASGTKTGCEVVLAAPGPPWKPAMALDQLVHMDVGRRAVVAGHRSRREGRPEMGLHPVVQGLRPDRVSALEHAMRRSIFMPRCAWTVVGVPGPMFGARMRRGGGVGRRRRPFHPPSE